MVARAVERYGGRDRWQRLRLTLTPASLGGLLPWFKGAGRTFDLPPHAEIIPSRAEATFFDYPKAGGIGRFQNGRVALADAPPAEHRHTFAGARKWRRWSALDALYFFGYAMTHYHAVPFTLADADVRRWEPSRRALTVAFPPAVHTHTPIQTFYFDETGLILRHDYVADIVGPWARGAHFWRDVETVDGFPVARHRRVVARIGRWLTPLVALEARFATPQVSFDA
jgi:hypothetical protein